MEELREIDHLHFLVHPVYGNTLSDRSTDMPRIMDAYCSKISVIAKNPKARLYIIPPERYKARREEQLNWLDELLLHAKLEMPGRFKVFNHDEVDDSELFRLKSKLSEGARLHFWGEYFGDCVPQQALKAAFALGVKPEEAEERIKLDRSHSVKKHRGSPGTPAAPLYMKRLANPETRRAAYDEVNPSAQGISRRVLTELYPEYYQRRKAGEKHWDLILAFKKRLERG